MSRADKIWSSAPPSIVDIGDFSPKSRMVITLAGSGKASRTLVVLSQLAPAISAGQVALMAMFSKSSSSSLACCMTSLELSMFN